MAYADSLADQTVCRLCPNGCRIKEGELGRCRARGRLGGRLSLPKTGFVSAGNVDPVEKKPLFHFYPGQKIFSLGFVGCSLRCGFCQNHLISQKTDSPGFFLPGNKIPALAKENRVNLAAFTYSEPLIHFEYLLEAAEACQKAGLKTALVTNGYLNAGPAAELLPYIDALNIDLKAFTDAFYRQELGGRLKPVTDFIQIAAEFCHTEVTTLIIPGKNDSVGEIEAASAFLAGVNRQIPYHLSAYHPAFKYRLPSTDGACVENLAKVAGKRLDFVYVGNLAGVDRSTYCPSCRQRLIKRSACQIKIENLSKNRCAKCGYAIAGKFDF